MRQKVLTGIVLLLIVGLLITIVKKSKPGQTDTVVNKPSSQKINILYYGSTCPHCHETIEWMEKNQVEKKVSIVRKEVYANKQNSRELLMRAKSCGLDTSRIGVPFMYTIGGKCLIGTPNIKAYLTTELDQKTEK